MRQTIVNLQLIDVSLDDFSVMWIGDPDGGQVFGRHPRYRSQVVTRRAEVPGVWQVVVGVEHHQPVGDDIVIWLLVHPVDGAG